MPSTIVHLDVVGGVTLKKNLLPFIFLANNKISTCRYPCIKRRLGISLDIRLNLS